MKFKVELYIEMDVPREVADEINQSQRGFKIALCQDIENDFVKLIRDSVTTKNLNVKGQAKIID